MVHRYDAFKSLDEILCTAHALCDKLILYREFVVRMVDKKPQRVLACFRISLSVSKYNAHYYY